MKDYRTNNFQIILNMKDILYIFNRKYWDTIYFFFKINIKY